MLVACNYRYGQLSLMQLDGLPCWQKLPAWALSVLNQINMVKFAESFLNLVCQAPETISCYREIFCHHLFTEANAPRLKCLSSGFRHGLDVLGVQMRSKDQ